MRPAWCISSDEVTDAEVQGFVVGFERCCRFQPEETSSVAREQRLEATEGRRRDVTAEPSPGRGAAAPYDQHPGRWVEVHVGDGVGGELRLTEQRRAGLVIAGDVSAVHGELVSQVRHKLRHRHLTAGPGNHCVWVVG